MILINLLPYREEKRKRRKQAFFAGIGVSAVLGLLIVGFVYLLLQHMTSEQQRRNSYLSAEIARLDLQIKDIANLKAEIEALQARQKAVEGLQTDRNTPVHLLNELARFTPEGIYLISIKQAEKVVTVVGIAQTQERVSEFLRNAGSGSEWLEKADLVEIKQANLTTTSRDQRRLFEFSMKVSIKTPQVEPDAGAKKGAPNKA
ncbi:PilN domain-containing protein [Pelomonas sp. SE-A7]|uniref:PilN domain-containing protein n=1 Tax=Pelomonas sp. SE-A7 TaxID=3054953 RepID=UPI00259CBC44|nr:PilN domain-containing protein [Pelomonas sp. SE-A7]MDM4767727.1 PilN domain-containing protein [Pelomonas sp. SE-A7]